MPVMPKKTKYRKQQKGRIRGKATRGNRVTDGEFGLQSLELGLITSNQIEAARVDMTRYINLPRQTNNNKTYWYSYG